MALLMHVRNDEKELHRHHTAHEWRNDFHDPDDEAIEDSARFIDEWADYAEFPTSFCYEVCASVMSALDEFADNELGDCSHWKKATGPIKLDWIKRVKLSRELDAESKLSLIGLFCGAE